MCHKNSLYEGELLYYKRAKSTGKTMVVFIRTTEEEKPLKVSAYLNMLSQPFLFMLQLYRLSMSLNVKTGLLLCSYYNAELRLYARLFIHKLTANLEEQSVSTGQWSKMAANQVHF